MSLGDYINKAKDMISEHPDQARNLLDKAESMIDSQTGGKFSSQIQQGGDALESQLGLGNSGQAGNPASADTAQPDPTQQGGNQTEDASTAQTVDATGSDPASADQSQNDAAASDTTSNDSVMDN